MKRLRNIISWILILTLCCGELFPAASVYAADIEVTQDDTAVSSDDAVVSEDDAAVSADEAVSEDAAVSEDEAAEEETSEEGVSEDEANVPEEEVTVPDDADEEPVEEQQGDYEDARCSSDVEIEEEIDVNDSYSELQFVMRVDQTEGRKAAASINKARDGRAVARFTYDNGLEEKACQRAAEAAIYYSNNRPDGSSFDTIYSSNVNADGKARKEILIRDGKTGAEAYEFFKSASANALISTGYTYMAVGHVVFEGTHYWALELTNATTNLADRAAKNENVTYTIKINDKYIKETGVTASLPSNSKINVDTNVPKALPTFTGYIISTEHKPEKAKLPIVCPAATWTYDKALASISNGKITAKCAEGTNFKITAKQKCANVEYTFDYNIHVIIHVKSVSISLVTPCDDLIVSGNDIKLKLDGSASFNVVVLPKDADDTSFTIKSENDAIVHIEAPKKKDQPWMARGASAGITKVWVYPTDDYNKVKDSMVLEVEGVDEVCDVEIFNYNGVVDRPTDVRLYCATPDTDIYYVTFWAKIEWEGDEETGQAVISYPTEEDRIKSNAEYDPSKGPEEGENKYFTHYSDHVTISQNAYLRAVAVKKADDKEGKENFKLSEYGEWIFFMEERSWGDVAVIDRGQFESAEDVPAGFWISEASMPEVEYTGKKLTPDSFRVYYNTTLLTNKKDYTISYKNNVNAGKEAQAIFTFKGNYQGKKERFFTIKARELSEATQTKSGVVYNNKPVDPKVKLSFNGKALVKDKDYKITGIEQYDKEGNTVSVNEINAAGEYDILLEGIGNFTGASRRSFIVAEKKSGLTPAKKLANFSKVVTVSNKDMITRPMDYDPDGIYPVPVVRPVSDNNIVLEEGIDYLVTYKNCNKAGTGSIVITGLEGAGYKGKISLKFKINKVSIKNLKEYTFITETATYEKKGAKPFVYIGYVVNDEFHELKEGVDYTLTYKNNKAVTNEKTKKMPAVVITGKGSFKDRTEEYRYTIEPSNIGMLNGNVPDKVYVAKPGAYKSTPAIYDTSGKKLKAGTDYDKAIFYRYDENCYVNVSGQTKQEFRKAGEQVGPKDIPDEGTVLHASVKGIGNYTGYFRIRYKICKSDITKAKITIADQYYTGSAVELKKSDIRFTKMIVGENDYEIVSYSNNVNVGVATVVLRGKGNFGGVATVKFNIKKNIFDRWIADRKPIFVEE